MISLYDLYRNDKDFADFVDYSLEIGIKNRKYQLELLKCLENVMVESALDVDKLKKYVEEKIRIQQSKLKHVTSHCNELTAYEKCFDDVEYKNVYGHKNAETDILVMFEVFDKLHFCLCQIRNIKGNLSGKDNMKLKLVLQMLKSFSSDVEEMFTPEP